MCCIYYIEYIPLIEPSIVYDGVHNLEQSSVICLRLMTSYIARICVAL